MGWRWERDYRIWRGIHHGEDHGVVIHCNARRICILLMLFNHQVVMVSMSMSMPKCSKNSEPNRP